MSLIDKLANSDYFMLFILILLVASQILKKVPMFTPFWLSIKALGKILPRLVKKLIKRKK